MHYNTAQCNIPAIPKELIIREAVNVLNLQFAEGGGYGRTYSVEEINDIFGAIIDRIGRHIFASHRVALGKLGLLYGDCSGVHLERCDYTYAYDPTCIIQYDRPTSRCRCDNPSYPAYDCGKGCHCVDDNVFPRSRLGGKQAELYCSEA